MSRNQYLKKQGNTWHVLVQVPARLRKAAGCWAYIRTLGTGDVNEANGRKHTFVADFKRRIAQLERGETANDVVAGLYDKALAWSETMAAARGQVLYQHPDGTEEYLTDFLLSEISDEAKEILEDQGEKVADRFYDIACLQGTPPLRTLVDQWLTEQAVTQQRKQHHRTAVSKFLTWTGDNHTTVSDVTRKVAGAYGSYLLNTKIERRTVGNYIGSLSTFWDWLERRGITETTNPWRRLGLGRRTAREGVSEKQKLTQWTDAALLKLLSGTYTARYHRILQDLIRLALVTGARLEELCALKTADVLKLDDGWHIRIAKGKTNAAKRTVPVHESAAHIIERRFGTQEYLFSSLTPGGGDQRRSFYVSKRFANYTRTLALPEGERKVFHSLRKSFVEVMEAARVPLSTIELIIGHKRKALALNTYSRGERVELRAAINEGMKHYAPAVMALIRQQTTDDAVEHQGEENVGLSAHVDSR